MSADLGLKIAATGGLLLFCLPFIVKATTDTSPIWLALLVSLLFLGGIATVLVGLLMAIWL